MSTTGVTALGGVGIALIIFLAILYFLPFLIANHRGRDSQLMIFLLNLLLGWTVLGWLVVLIMACSGENRDQRQMRQAMLATMQAQTQATIGLARQGMSRTANNPGPSIQQFIAPGVGTQQFVERAWHYADAANAQCGPIPAVEIRRLYALRRIGPDTLVWTDGMVEWRPLSNCMAALGL